ncbi:protein THEMIS2 [Menidia menidia]
MADTNALPLEEFIASLDNDSLPKILQVCSGVYFQGSVYEISGSEVCFSTGDLIKVIGIELLSVSCEDVSSNEKFVLPINHTGLFKVVPEAIAYNSVEELLSLRPVGLESSLPFTFTSSSKMTLGALSLGSGRTFTVLSIDRREGEEDQVRCHVKGPDDVSAEVRIPMSSRGEFYECESEECFTLKEIMSSPCLRSRRFRFVNTTKYERPLVFSPVYEVHAIMSLRKHVLKFPSNLEVDVVDVTHISKDMHFVTPLSLTEVLTQPDESFPAVMEILEGPEPPALFKCSWLPELNKNQRLVFHQKGTMAMALLSSMKGRKTKQYFLASQQYGGRLRRRPREFNSVYELYVASTQKPGLKVSVTRNCEEVEEEGLPALSVGDQLEIVRCSRMEVPCEKDQKQSIEALLCQCLPDPNDVDDDEDGEEVREETEKTEVLLPLYMQGHFVEVLGDNKKYRLDDLMKEFSSPLDVKVVSRDTELETDPLVGFASLRIEGALMEPTIQASFPHRPDLRFQIPAQWLSLSVCFTEDPLPGPHDQPPKFCTESVLEVTDTFFYEYHKKGNPDEAPPPRPPKRDLTSHTSKSKKKPHKSMKSKDNPQKSIPTDQFSVLTLTNKKKGPAPPPPGDLDCEPPPIAPRKLSDSGMGTVKAKPNTYVTQTQRKVPWNDIPADMDSDHDYETVDDTLVAMMKTAQESVTFY